MALRTSSNGGALGISILPVVAQPRLYTPWEFHCKHLQIAFRNAVFGWRIRTSKIGWSHLRIWNGWKVEKSWTSRQKTGEKTSVTFWKRPTILRGSRKEKWNLCNDGRFEPQGWGVKYVWVFGGQWSQQKRSDQLSLGIINLLWGKKACVSGGQKLGLHHKNWKERLLLMAEIRHQLTW